jgi:hypothetical protein
MDVSLRKSKIEAMLSKTVKRNEEAISKENITDIPNKCSDSRLKTQVMLLAVTRCVLSKHCIVVLKIS